MLGLIFFRVLDAESRSWICSRIKDYFGKFGAAKVLQNFCRLKRLCKLYNIKSFFQKLKKISLIFHIYCRHTVMYYVKQLKKTHTINFHKPDNQNDEIFNQDVAKKPRRQHLIG